MTSVISIDYFKRRKVLFDITVLVKEVNEVDKKLTKLFSANIYR